MDKSILVIEDDATLRNLLSEILEFEGYQVITARDGLDGLEKLKDNRPVLILLDLMMPKMDGITFVEELERRGLHPMIPVIILTADHLARERVSRVEPEGYIEKPMEIRTLLEEITRITLDAG
ncbi:MAG: response regulator [Ardenticatenaceae bacterium]|nr:response regulator [Ardenticatenaceae bacterium]HBY98768.1 response regulator [Chloroflexota bacterium]